MSTCPPRYVVYCREVCSYDSISTCNMQSICGLRGVCVYEHPCKGVWDLCLHGP